MPLIKDFRTDCDSHILIWKDQETLAFFIERTTLSENEKELLSNYTNDRRKKDLLISRYLIQCIIPGAEVNYLESGKPYLKNRDAEISISHSKDIVAIIVNKNKIVGLDIEYISPRVDKLAKRFLSGEEIYLAKNTALRTLYWSAKETLFKLDKEQGLDFKTQISLTPKDENKLEGKIRGSLPIEVNYWDNLEWVLTYASID